jgi:acyl-CoA hydrolase
MTDIHQPETIVSHLIKPEDLNHHGTLFAGRMAEWLIEACFIAATRSAGRPEDVICACVRQMAFEEPLRSGAIVELRARVTDLGTTSLTVTGEAFRSRSSTPSVTISAVFVTVDAEGRPYAHGLTRAG